MKVVYAGLAVLMAGFAYQQLSYSPGIDPFTTASIGSNVTTERFRLVSAGTDDNCVITAVGDGLRKDLKLTPDCKSQVPALAHAQVWEDRPDGSVAFLNGNGGVMVEFATGDGVALESFAPREPMMSLQAL
jgi:hypothetical protein